MIMVSEKRRKASISYDDWRKRVLRSETTFPEIRFIPEIRVNCKHDQFNERSNLGSKRIDEETPRNSAA